MPVDKQLAYHRLSVIVTIIFVPLRPKIRVII